MFRITFFSENMNDSGNECFTALGTSLDEGKQCGRIHPHVTDGAFEVAQYRPLRFVHSLNVHLSQTATKDGVKSRFCLSLRF